MLNPDAAKPVDPDVPVPPGVKRAAEAAAALHAQAYGAPVQTDPNPAPVTDPAAPAPANTPAQPNPAPANATVQPNPAPVKPAVPETGEPGSWEHRYLAMKGRYDQSMQQVGSLQGQLAEMGDELMRSNALLREAPEARPAPTRGPQPGQPPRKLLTAEDEKTYGSELIDFVKRAAAEAVAPVLEQTSSQVRQVAQQVTRNAQQDMHTDLDAAVPTWQAINEDPAFKAWCRLPDIYSGQIRSRLLNTAYQAADAPRVIAFFKGFLAEGQATGQLPVPSVQQQDPPAPREPAVNLEVLTAPGRPKPAGGQTTPNAADKPVITRDQIKKFYELVRTGHYYGREADKMNDEQIIFAAQQEGRVRG